eukprot:scpid44306/ scgid4696/ Vacuolar protein sorting-associated protein 9A
MRLPMVQSHHTTYRYVQSDARSPHHKCASYVPGECAPVCGCVLLCVFVCSCRFISKFTQQQVPKPIEDLVDEIRQFLDDTSLVIERHPLWRTASDEETMIAAEALERYTMHKVHKCVYSPSREDDARRDREFVQQLESLSFITPNLLDIPLSGPTCEAGWEVASNQLKKMESCKSPRDKVTCVMNLFTVLCKLLVDVGSGNAAGADDLMPNVIYIILRAKPAHWFSDVRYIQRFRHPGRLSSEAGYYMTQMMGAVAFLEKVEARHLSLTEAEFQKAKRGEFTPPTRPPQEKKRSRKSSPSTEDETPVGPSSTTGTTASEDVQAAQASAEPTTEVPELSKQEFIKRLSSCSTSSVNSTSSNRSSTHSASSSPAVSRRHRSDSNKGNHLSNSGTPSSTSPAMAARHVITPTRQKSSTGSEADVRDGVTPTASALPTEGSNDAYSIAIAASVSASDRAAEAAIRKVSTLAPDLDPSNPMSMLSPLTSVTGSPVPEAGIVERFLNCKFKEMTVGDMTELLKNYRILVHKYSTLRAQMATVSATSTQARLLEAQRCAAANGGGGGGGEAGVAAGSTVSSATTPAAAVARQQSSSSRLSSTLSPVSSASSSSSSSANQSMPINARSSAGGGSNGSTSDPSRESAPAGGDAVFISNPAAMLN